MVYQKIQDLMIVLVFIAGFSEIASNVCAEDEMFRISKEEAREKLDDPRGDFFQTGGNNAGQTAFFI